MCAGLMKGNSGIVIEDVCEDGTRKLGGAAGVNAHKGRYFSW